MSSNNNVIEVREQPQQPSVFDPVIKQFTSPMMLGYLALMIALLIIKAMGGNATTLESDRFATAAEVRRGCKLGQEQIAKGSLEDSALELEDITLASVQPSIAVVGKSGMGKTRYIADPAIRSAIDQGWTNFVFDVKGSLIRKHAAYALSKGYEVYIYAPGRDYSDGFNFLELMEDQNDARTAEEIAKTLEHNFGEPGERKDGFFSPQGVALLRLVFMMAKSTAYPDLLMAWKFLSLPDLAKRLKAAQEYYSEFGTSSFELWVREATTVLQSMASSDKTVESIVGTAMTNFLRMIDPKITPCLINHTIPLDLRGKQIVFFQLDENAKSATAPLVAAAIQMLLVRNLNASVKRDRPLGLFLDEFDSISLPDIKDNINKMREYGLVAMLLYQSDAQIYHRYTKEYAIAILTSCVTKIYFNPGHDETAEKISKSLGEKEVRYKTESRNYGGRSTRTISEHSKMERLMSRSKVKRMRKRVAVIVDCPGFENRPHKKRFRINRKNNKLWGEIMPSIWSKSIKPYRKEQLKLKKSNMEVEIINRQVLASATLLSVREVEILKTIAA